MRENVRTQNIMNKKTMAVKTYKSFKQMILLYNKHVRVVKTERLKIACFGFAGSNPVACIIYHCINYAKTPLVGYTTCGIHHLSVTPLVGYTTCRIHHLSVTPLVAQNKNDFCDQVGRVISRNHDFSCS